MRTIVLKYRPQPPDGFEDGVETISEAVDMAFGDMFNDENFSALLLVQLWLLYTSQQDLVQFYYRG